MFKACDEERPRGAAVAGAEREDGHHGSVTLAVRSQHGRWHEVLQHIRPIEVVFWIAGSSHALIGRANGKVQIQSDSVRKPCDQVRLQPGHHTSTLEQGLHAHPHEPATFGFVWRSVSLDTGKADSLVADKCKVVPVYSGIQRPPLMLPCLYHKITTTGIGGHDILTRCLRDAHKVWKVGLQRLADSDLAIAGCAPPPTSSSLQDC